MLELTINETVYQFHFGMGFMREVNKKIGVPVDGIPDVKKHIGLQYKIAGIIDRDVEDLVDVLDAANKSQKPRVTRDLLDSYIDDENTDIEELFETVLNFLKKANATKKTWENLNQKMQEALETEKTEKE